MAEVIRLLVAAPMREDQVREILESEGELDIEICLIVRHDEMDIVLDSSVYQVTVQNREVNCNVPEGEA